MSLCSVFLKSHVLTWCCGGPINGKSFHLMSLEGKHGRRWFLISDICRHNIRIIHCIEWACQIPDVYFAFFRPCCCYMLLTNSCCLHTQKKTNIKLKTKKWQRNLINLFLLKKIFSKTCLTLILLTQPACLTRAVSSSGLLSSSSSLSESLSSASSDLGFDVRWRLLILMTITWFCCPLALCEPETA